MLRDEVAYSGSNATRYRQYDGREGLVPNFVILLPGNGILEVLLCRWIQVSEERPLGTSIASV